MGTLAFFLAMLSARLVVSAIGVWSVILFSEQ